MYFKKCTNAGIPHTLKQSGKLFHRYAGKQS